MAVDIVFPACSSSEGNTRTSKRIFTQSSDYWLIKRKATLDEALGKAGTFDEQIMKWTKTGKCRGGAMSMKSVRRSWEVGLILWGTDEAPQSLSRICISQCLPPRDLFTTPLYLFPIVPIYCEIGESLTPGLSFFSFLIGN